VVLGETRAHDLDEITKGIRFLVGGAHFLATNPDAADPP
jgi:NagD protein